MIYCDPSEIEVNTKFPRGTYVTHLRSGKRYQIVSDPDVCRLEAENEPAYAYELLNATEREKDPRVWVRSQKEMEDGRFRKFHPRGGADVYVLPVKSNDGKKPNDYCD